MRPHPVGPSEAAEGSPRNLGLREAANDHEVRHNAQAPPQDFVIALRRVS